MLKPYESKKIVVAGEMSSIDFSDDDTATITFVGGEIKRVHSKNLRHRLPDSRPVFVIFYQDGYVSFCPKETFEREYWEAPYHEHGG